MEYDPESNPDNWFEDVEEEEEFDYEEWLEKEDERMSYCTCGAYGLNKNTGHYIQCADCICGNV